MSQPIIAKLEVFRASDLTLRQRGKVADAIVSNEEHPRIHLSIRDCPGLEVVQLDWLSQQAEAVIADGNEYADLYTAKLYEPA